jgi:hypothetical protein
MEDMNTVVLRTIDKLSARTHTFDIPVERTVKFGNSLFIKARACRRSSPLDQPESASFLQIWERKPGEEDSRWLFSGWMFASTPSLSSLDHPVYDVWVMECKNAATSKSADGFSSETAPEHAPEADAPEALKPGAAEAVAPAEKPETSASTSEGAAEVKPVPAPEPAHPPADSAPPAIPPLEALPGSFETGEDGEATPE